MSEPKRILLPQIGVVDGGGKKSGSATIAVAATAASSTISSSTSSSTTIRLDLNLFEPNADSFPEFNYSKLLHVEKKKKKKISKLNGFSDPFEENNDDVDRIAKEFERKYGNAYCGKKGRSNIDYFDKGAGYDDNDDFIDNTEAYDEIIPDEIETDRGGFYINSGALQFKQLPNFERPEDAVRMPKPRKRQLSTSSEEGSSYETENERKNPLKNGHLEKKAKIHDKIKDKKVDKIKIKEKKDDGAGSDSGKDTAAATTAVATVAAAAATAAATAAAATTKKPVKTTTVKDMLRAKRDSMRNTMLDGGNKSEQTEEDSENESSSSGNSSESSDDDDNDDEDGDDRDGQVKKDNPQRIPGDIKLPETLSEDLLGYIGQIVEAAKTNNTGKHNFFDAANMDLLYKIDLMARAKGPNVRHQIYNYLEVHLPCTKQTILMRAKKIRIQKEENKTNKILTKLKLAVDSLMPDYQQSYDIECKRISELRTAAASQNGTSNGGDKTEQTYKMPRKRFTWTDETRTLIYELINARKQSFNVIKLRKETVEDFVNRYLKDSVVKVWPDGWMKMEELHKEYERRKSNVAKTKENKKSAERLNAGPVPATTSIADTLPSTVSANNQKDALPLVTATNNNNVLPTTKSNSNPTKSVSPTQMQSTKETTQTTKTVSTVTTAGTANNPILVTANDTKVTVVSTAKSNNTKLNVANPPSSSSSSLSSVAVDQSITVTSVAALLTSTSNSAAATTASSAAHISTPNFGSSLTITPVGANDVTSKPLPSVQNKVTITNVEPSVRTSQTSSSSTKNSPTSDEIKESSKTKMNSSPITAVIGNSTTITSINSNSTSKAVNLATDHTVTPPKRSTDHSINSIISSPTGIGPIGKNDSVLSIDITSPTKKSSTPASPRSVTAASPTGSTTTTHVINLDNLKTKNDILTTAAAAQSKGSTAPTSSASTTVPSECNIRIRSVETVNSFLDTVPNNSTKSTSTSAAAAAASVVNIIDDDIEEIDSSSSDDVEFVGISVSNVKRRKPGPKSKTNMLFSRKHKYRKGSSNTSSRSNSPQIMQVNSLATHKSMGKIGAVKEESRRKADCVVDNNKDGDFDVNQIMKELKELQEMQNKASSIHSSENNSSHHKGGLHHSASLPYKKLEISDHTTPLSRSSS